MNYKRVCLSNGLQQDQVVAVDYVLAIVVAEYALDIARVAAGDTADIHHRILADTAGDAALVALFVAQPYLDHVATAEITFRTGYATGQQ